MKRQQQKVSTSIETKRCAIYTRKSMPVRQEQEFTTLDAQREACAGYIQRQPGWVLVPERYDDDGFTGANMERPAFQRLMEDLDAGKIDVVVVYKVDRLSRSLLDFAKVMERLKAANASFVSVTQNFSTADAMGRLTLNMLMSFAEFEREMIAERTKDKVAAARRKGKWTGKEACPAKPMPAPVIEEYVVGRLVEATADGALVEGARSALENHLAERRERLMTRRAKLPGQIAKASANVARYVEELTRLQGRAREAVAQRLEQESERLATLEETMAEAERTLESLEAQRVEGEWVAQALGDFSRVWSALTPANQGRLLRALVAKVVVDEQGERVEVHLVDFAADPEVEPTATVAEPEEAVA